MTELLLVLLLAHVLGDFYLQPQPWIDSRYQDKIRSLGLFKHILVHAGLAAVALLVAAWRYDLSNSWALLASWLVIVLSHYAIDVWKSYQKGGFLYFAIDQIAHLLVIVVLWLALQYHFTSEPQALLAQWLEAIPLQTVLGIVLVYLAASTPTNIVLNMALAPYKPQPTNFSNLDKADFAASPLERWLIISLLLLDQLLLVGLLVVVSAIFRVAAMLRANDRHDAHHVLLDWLLNLTAALSLGFLVNLLIETNS